MGLAKRIIPAILHKNGRLVKGRQFVSDRVIGVALQQARIYASRGVDELLILDVSATKEGREPNYQLIKSLAKYCFAPITVGGGISCESHVRKLLQSGADKVCLGTHAGTLTEKIADKYGRSTVVVSVDYKEGDQINTKEMEDKGAGEILLQSMDRDGMMSGYDLDTIGRIAPQLNIPVVVAGGCSGYPDMANALDCGADAVAAGALFAFTDATPKGAAEYLSCAGYEVRM